ncbi:MAG: transaldolase [Arcobacteraceae bacterium]|jgi:transaldolase|nr:transaldolase [Arcobacteraceae bacterium]
MNFKKTINFSLWCDFIERDFLENEFGGLIEEGIIHGATSNPAIFEQAISSSDAYGQQISMLQANENKKIYEELAITDIKRAAEILYPLYEADSDDGFISIEVDPTLCDDAMGTIEEGTRLFHAIGHSNVMIKIPATEAGYVAMENLTSMGINVNATLIFTPAQAIECAKALNSGIEKSKKETKAVISIFVSRFDRELDSTLKVKGLEPMKCGIINATKCYHEILKIENKNIRTLFASTGVKGDEVDPSYYIENLIFPHSVNTAPLGTIKEYMKRDEFLISTLLSEDECDKYFVKLASQDISLGQVGNKLLTDGLEAFKVSFAQMLKKLKK